MYPAYRQGPFQFCMTCIVYTILTSIPFLHVHYPVYRLSPFQFSGPASGHGTVPPVPGVSHRHSLDPYRYKSGDDKREKG